MCEACDLEFVASAALGAELISCMRAIEAAMPGEPAAKEDWAVFLGQAGGAIGWAQYQRMLISRHAALEDLSPARSLPRASMRCEAV
jgi:hypothetical protein